MLLFSIIPRPVLLLCLLLLLAQTATSASYGEDDYEYFLDDLFDAFDDGPIRGGYKTFDYSGKMPYVDITAQSIHKYACKAFQGKWCGAMSGSKVYTNGTVDAVYEADYCATITGSGGSDSSPCLMSAFSAPENVYYAGSYMQGTLEASFVAAPNDDYTTLDSQSFGLPYFVGEDCFGGGGGGGKKSRKKSGKKSVSHGASCKLCISRKYSSQTLASASTAAFAESGLGRLCREPREDDLGNVVPKFWLGLEGELSSPIAARLLLDGFFAAGLILMTSTFDFNTLNTRKRPNILFAYDPPILWDPRTWNIA